MQIFPGLIADDIMMSFSISAKQTGTLVASMFWSIIIFQIFSGVILDKFGFRLIGAVSLVISATGLLIFVSGANKANIYYAYFGRIMMGIGSSFATIGYIKAISIWFSTKRFAFISSFLVSAAMLGAIIGQIPLSYLIKYTNSWQYSLIICSYLGYVISFLYYLVIRNNNPKKKYYAKKSKKVSNLKEIKSVFFNYKNWLLTCYAGLSFTAIDTFAGLWGNNYFREQYEISLENAAWILSAIFIGLAIGAPVISNFSKRYESYRLLMIISHIIATVMLALVLLLKTNIVITTFLLFFFGFFMGAYILTFTIGKNLNNLSVTATVAALINTGEPIFGAILDPLIGYLLEKKWNKVYIVDIGNLTNYVPKVLKKFNINCYHSAFSIIIACMVVALFILLFIKEKRQK